MSFKPSYQLIITPNERRTDICYSPHHRDLGYIRAVAGSSSGIGPSPTWIILKGVYNFLRGLLVRPKEIGVYEDGSNGLELDSEELSE